MLDPPSIGDHRGEGEEKHVAAGYERGRQTTRVQRDLRIAGEGRFAQGAEHGQIENVIGTELRRPAWKSIAKPIQDRSSAVQLDGVPLPIGEAHRLDTLKTVERPGKARRRILTTREEDQCRVLCHRSPPYP